MEPLGENLVRSAETAKSEILMCAPFIKRRTVARVLASASVPSLRIYTRWRAEEVAAGVSDTAVLDEVVTRNGTVSLCDPLHAKYFRFDDVAFVGSANLTDAALGWSRTPNLELLLDASPINGALEAFEIRLDELSVRATPDIAAAIEAAAALLPMPEVLTDNVDDEEEGVRGLGDFMPTLREPKDLVRAYMRGPEVLASGPAQAAQADLAALQLPRGLSEKALRATVASRLLQARQIASVDQLLESSQRFGAIRDVIGREQNLERDEAGRRWQTLMRWLLEFMPERYELAVPRHSEVMRRRRG